MMKNTEPLDIVIIPMIKTTLMIKVYLSYYVNGLLSSGGCIPDRVKNVPHHLIVLQIVRQVFCQKV